MELQGLQWFEKVKPVMNKLSDMESKIVFLEETHLVEEEKVAW